MGFILWWNRRCGFTSVQRSLLLVIWILLGEITNIKEESTTNIFFLHKYVCSMISVLSNWFEQLIQGRHKRPGAKSKSCGRTPTDAPGKCSSNASSQRLKARVSRVGLGVCSSPAGRGWCAYWGNWLVCWATELSPSETDTYSVASTFRRPPGSVSHPPDLHPRGWTSADGGADMQLWETEKGLTTCGEKQNEGIDI